MKTKGVLYQLRDGKIARSEATELARRQARGRRCAEEAELVSRVLAGDTEAYRPLVESYERPVLGVVRRLLRRGGAEAEDVAQETFIRAFERLGQLSAWDRFGPWLFQIARSLCRDRIRRLEIERKALEQRWELLRLEFVPARKDLDSSLSQLPPNEHEVLKMRYFDGMTYDEIAARRGLTFSQVDHLIRKARARLARRIKVERRCERAL